MTDQERMADYWKQREDYWKQVDNEPRCDVCNQHMEEVEWCGECGNCTTHCDCTPCITCSNEPTKPKQYRYSFALHYDTENESLEEATSEFRAWLSDHYHHAELQVVETDDPTLDSPFIIYTK